MSYINEKIKLKQSEFEDLISSNEVNGHYDNKRAKNLEKRMHISPLYVAKKSNNHNDNTSELVEDISKLIDEKNESNTGLMDKNIQLINLDKLKKYFNSLEKVKEEKLKDLIIKRNDLSERYNFTRYFDNAGYGLSFFVFVMYVMQLDRNFLVFSTVLLILSIIFSKNKIENKKIIMDLTEVIVKEQNVLREQKAEHMKLLDDIKIT